ncbi:MAG: DUF3846 domain-containing protein [Oscillospiraceae bacterium]|nr:DUF3846 domain-containing protein [Oscillospiraceae bacterium]
MKVLLIEPMKQPRVAEIPDTLEALQKAVGGTIQAVYPWEDPVAIVCADEGKLQGFPPNRMLEDYDILVGTFLITGLGEENFASLTDDLIRKYTEKYRWPEAFVRDENGLFCLRLKDDGIEVHSL